MLGSVTQQGRRRRTAGAVVRGPARRGTFVVRWRLRIGGLLSGVLLIASLGWLVFLVPTTPWWITPMFRSVDGLGSLLISLFTLVLWLGLPGTVAVLAWIRPGNAALRRRVLAMDTEGVWIYESATWWSTPRLVPWRDASPVRVYTLDHTDVEPADTGPALVPWDFLAFGDPPRATIHLLWLTATVEDIVAQARRRRPDLTVLDQRTPPVPGPGGWVLRRRRRPRCGASRRCSRRGRICPE